MTNDKLDISRRKALLGLGTIGVASAGAGIGTSALFSDEESFTGNSITAGKLDLLVDYTTSVSQDGAGTGSTTNDGTIDGGESMEYVIKDAKPGDSGSLRFCPKVVDNPGWVWVGGQITSESGGDNPEPEPTPDNGELAENIQVDVSYCDDSGSGSSKQPLQNPADYTLVDLFKELESGFLLDGDRGIFGGGASGTQAYPGSSGSGDQQGPCLCIEWEIPTSVGNEIMGDSLEFDITFEAVQERNNAVPENPFAAATVAPGGSIQSAINGASPGDVVSVHGMGGATYDEALSIDKSLTLARASAEMPLIDESGDSKFRTVQIKASDVVFDGFEVTGEEHAQQNYGIRVEAPSNDALSNIQVCNCLIRDIVAEARATGIGIDADQGPLPTPGANGTINNVEVYNCRIENISNTAPLSPAPYGDSRAKGIAMNGRIFDPTVRHVTIQDVGDSSNTTFGRGITITEDSTPSPPVGGTNFEIVLSDISGMEGAFTSGGTNFGGAAMFVGEYPDFGDHVVENNNIENLVENFGSGGSTDTLNAPNNYWDASDGPSGAGSGSGVLVTPNVDFTPFRSSSVSDAGSSI